LVQFGPEFQHVISNAQEMFKNERSKVKVTASKRRLIAKLLLSFRKSESLNLMAIS